MSTKIYSGFRLTARTLREAMDDLAYVTKECARILHRRQAHFLAHATADMLDRAALADLSVERALAEETSPIGYADSLLMDRQAEVRKTRRRDPAVDYEVIFRLWLCRNTGALIGYVIGEGDEEFLSVLLRSKKATEYGYWNNTDHPKHLNERQWKKRGDIWEALLSGKSGPWFDVRVPEPMRPDIAIVLEEIPAFEKRVNNYAEDLAFDAWFRGTGLPQPELPAVSQYTAFRRALRNGSGEEQRHYMLAKERVSARLAPVITREALTTRVKSASASVPEPA